MVQTALTHQVNRYQAVHCLVALPVSGCSLDQESTIGMAKKMLDGYQPSSIFSIEFSHLRRLRDFHTDSESDTGRTTAQLRSSTPQQNQSFHPRNTKQGLCQARHFLYHARLFLNQTRYCLCLCLHSRCLRSRLRCLRCLRFNQSNGTKQDSSPTQQGTANLSRFDQFYCGLHLTAMSRTLVAGQAVNPFTDMIISVGRCFFNKKAFSSEKSKFIDV